MKSKTYTDLSWNYTYYISQTFHFFFFFFFFLSLFFFITIYIAGIQNYDDKITKCPIIISIDCTFRDVEFKVTLRPSLVKYGHLVLT